MKQIEIEIGTIKLGEKVVITDPCYTNGLGVYTNVRKGNYKCFAVQENSSFWGKRIGKLIAYLEGFESVRYDYDNMFNDNLIGLAGVDSGQCGIFDDKYYSPLHINYYVDEDEKSERWYKRCCKITLNGDECGTIGKRGVVSSSGYGDGCYDVYAIEDKGEVVAIMIDFIPNEIREEHEEYEEEE